MKRTTVGALFAAAALLLAGCGSTGGTATAGTTVAPTAAASETMAPTTESPMETSAEAPPTEESTSEQMTTSDEPSEDTTTDEPSEDTTTDAPSTTLGGDATGIDAQTTAWFDTFCTSLAPVKDLQNLQSQVDPSDPKKTLKVVAAAMAKLGAAFTDAGSKLKDAPKPSFDGGAEFADKIVSSFTELGPKFTALGVKFAKADPSDPSSLSDLSTLSTDLQDAVKPLQDLQNIKVTPAVSQGIAAIPSCQALAG